LVIITMLTIPCTLTLTPIRHLRITTPITAHNHQRWSHGLSGQLLTRSALLSFAF
jgi:hypothetical protein|tara:strand:+ start:6781 stop:6945 length:165 start_codon:yes stop_codon:yes gene_type:complete